MLQVLLSRHTAQDDIAIATPHYNRRHTEVEGVQGCFVNTLAIRISSAEDPSFQQLLQRVKAAVGGAILPRRRALPGSRRGGGRAPRRSTHLPGVSPEEWLTTMCSQTALPWLPCA